MLRSGLISKTLRRSAAAAALPLSVTLLLGTTSGCKWFSRSKLATSEQDEHPEIKRLAAEFGRIRKLFPQPEFEDITNQIYSRFKLIYTDPKEGLNKPALIFVLNSLPGTGKTYYAQQIARALEIENKESYHVYEMKPSDHFLNFEKVVQFAATKASIDNVHAHRTIQPSVLLYDEYSLAATLAGTNKDSLQDQIMELRKRLNDADFAGVAARLKEKVTEIRRKGKLTRLNTEATAEADDTEAVWDFILGELSDNANKYSAMYTEAARDLKQIADERKVANTAEAQTLKAKSDENLGILWAALGNGILPKKNLKNDPSLGEALKQTAETINPKIKEQKLKFIERIIKDYERSKLNQELKEIEEAQQRAQIKPQPSAYRPSAGGFNSLSSVGASSSSSSSPPAPTDRQKIVIEKLRAVDTAISEIDGEIRRIEQDIDTEVSRVKHVMLSIVSAYGADVVDEVATKFGIKDTDEVWNREFTNRVEEFAATSGVQSAEVRPLLDTLKTELLRINKTGGPADMLLSLFKEQPQTFYSVYQDSLVSRSVDEDRLTGNIVIFLAGNVLSLQEEVITNVLAKGESQCQPPGDKNKSTVPFYRDPDCLLKITKDILKDPKSAQEMEDTLLRVLGKKTVDLKELKDANPIASNALAFKSRIGPIRFILPPSSKDYRGFLDRQLQAVAATFKKGAKVDLAFTPSVIDSFLYPKFVNSTLGFRNLVDRARYQFDLTLDNEVRAIVAQVGNAPPDQPVAANPKQKCNIKDSITSLGERVTYTAKVPLEPVHTVFVDFKPGNRPANGELVFGGVSNVEGKKKTRPWFKVNETTVVEDDSFDRKLNTFQRVAYARYIAAIYGSMGLLAASLPTEPLSLASSIGGVPNAARGPVAQGLDLSAFRSNLQYYNIEIQASIGAIAAYNAIDRLEDPPPELVQRAASTKVMIDDLWDKLQSQMGLGFEMERLLARDANNDVSGNPVSESDPIFKAFMTIYTANPSKKQLSDDDKTFVYKATLDHFLGIFEKNRSYLDAIEAIASTVQARLEEIAQQKATSSEVTAGEIERIFNDVVGIKFVTQPGSHGTVRCNAYRQAYGIELEVDLGGSLSPAKELLARGLFGRVAQRAGQDLQRITDVFKQKAGEAANTSD